MDISAFDYHLPEALIAQYPTERRADSRLLILDANAEARGSSGELPRELQETRFSEITRFLSPGDLMVFNDTRVIPARLFAKKDTGGKVEILAERILDDRRILAQARSGKPLRPGASIQIMAPDASAPSREGSPAKIGMEVLERRGDFFVLQATGGHGIHELLEKWGRVPLPPYIRRSAGALDEARYQTVYGKHKGAVAAPTAGLHFDEPLLAELRAKGIHTAFITLHVGAGTFSPVRVQRIETHRMHAEYLHVSEAVCDQVEQTRRMGGRVIAVGTTSVRALESAWQSGRMRPFQGETELFIYPGYHFHCVDAMVTNFHLPGSTLLMLVSAFAGRERLLDAYGYAVEKGFRFYSYGDAMVIFR